MNSTKQTTKTSDATVQYCTFYLDDALYGVAINELQEIVRYREMMTVPMAPPEVAGLLNLRGQIVMAIDLRLQMGMTPHGPDSQPVNLIVRSKKDNASLLVDRIGDIVKVDRNEFEPSPSTLSAELSEIVLGSYKLKDQLLVIINPEAACRIATPEFA